VRRLKKKTPLIIAVLLAMILIIAVTRVVSYIHTGTVVKKVFDGDSVLLFDGREIRYIGIDAPETGGKRPAEEGGREAARENETLVGGKEVRLEFDRELTDRYKRTLAYVYVGDTFVNLTLVKDGVALALPYAPNLKHQRELKKAMDEARRARRGLWADPDRWMVRADDARRYVGESKTVVGRVLSSEEASPGVFLNFGEDFTTDFTAFIPRDDLSFFADEGIADPASAFRNRTIEVTGTIHEKNGPSITVRHPDQIYVRNEP
jgi:micrococcal nuclease